MEKPPPVLCFPRDHPVRTSRFPLLMTFALLIGCQDQLPTVRTERLGPRQRPHEGFASRGEVRTGWIAGPDGRPMQVTFEIHEGRAIIEGDIDLGPVETIPATPEAVARLGGPRYGVIVNGDSYRWTNGIVHFTIDPTFNASQRQTILNAIGYIHSVNPGVSFGEVAASTRIHFRYSTSGCSSPVGRQGGVQEIKLVANCASSMGTVVHEVLHSLGMRHEQSRCDRNNYVLINTQNIESGYSHNFDRYCSDHTDIGPYDEGSIMHYDPYAFSANGLPTIQSLRGLAHQMGQRSGLSTADVRTVDWMYPRPLNVSLVYPSNVPALSWEAYPQATYYEVYRVLYSEIRDSFGASQYSITRALIATTAGTLASDAGRGYTGTGSCYWQSGNTQYETSEYYEVWAYTPSVQGGLRKGGVGAHISECSQAPPEDPDIR